MNRRPWRVGESASRPVGKTALVASADGLTGRLAESRTAPESETQGLFEGVPATAYSPALSRAEYHRRCRA